MPLTKIQSLGITDGTIVNADINASAAIAGTKLSGAGKLLQVVSTTTATQFSSASATPVDIISLSITPSSASNKILITASLSECFKNGGTLGATFNLLRGATNLVPQISLNNNLGSTSAEAMTNIGYSFLDSPNTTSSTTYKVTFNRQGGTSTHRVNQDGGTSTLILFEIAG
jgi:hypothetical protein